MLLTRRRGHPLSILALIATLLLGAIAVTPAIAAAQPIPPPTVGEVVVESFDCETGVLVFHVGVTNLQHVVSPTSDFDVLFKWNYLARFEGGGSSSTPNEFDVYNPPTSGSPYTGDVSITSTIPTIAPGGGATPNPITSIELSAAVYLLASEPPTDTTSTVYTVDCDVDSLIDSLVAALKRILQDILA
jgi:hypothetical protein